jgi:hypothetical protein
MHLLTEWYVFLGVMMGFFERRSSNQSNGINVAFQLASFIFCLPIYSLWLKLTYGKLGRESMSSKTNQNRERADETLLDMERMIGSLASRILGSYHRGILFSSGEDPSLGLSTGSREGWRITQHAQFRCLLQMLMGIENYLKD